MKYYKVITASSIEDLVGLTTIEIEDGYIPCGGILFETSGYSGRYMQSVYMPLNTQICHKKTQKSSKNLIDIL